MRAEQRLDLPLADSRWARHQSLVDWAVGLAAAFVCLAIMLLTEPPLAIVWDEGYTLGRQERVRAWFGALRDPAAFAAGWQDPGLELVPPNRIPAPARSQLNTRAGLLSPAVIAWFWPFAREEPDGHPPVYALVGLVGDFLAPSWEALPRARLGPILVYSLTCGALAASFQSRHGGWSAFAAAGAWIFQPHLFALAHYATYDGLLTSLWTGCLLSFARAAEPADIDSARVTRLLWMAIFGLLLAGAMGTKLTGWLIPLPCLAWSIVYRDRRGLLTLAAGTALAVIVLIALVPPWWHHPLAGLDAFFRSNLSRAQSAPLKTLFLGTIYETPTGSLPWYNTIIWTAIVTPVGFLLLAAIGTVRALARARSDRFGALILVNWVFLMVLRALPHTPGHDAVRQFLPAFGVLALLVGLGARAVERRFGAWGKSLIVAAVVEGSVSVGLMMPVPLSYYSPLIGGLPGAVAAGMEPTFYWDALQPEILDWLNSHTATGQKVRFSRYPTSLLYLRKTQRLRVGILPTDPGDWAWYVVQNRTGALDRMQRDLIAHGHPEAVYQKWGVPLLWVFPYREVEAWERGELTREPHRD